MTSNIFLVYHVVMTAVFLQHAKCINRYSLRLLLTKVSLVLSKFLSGHRV